MLITEHGAHLAHGCSPNLPAGPTASLCDMLSHPGKKPCVDRGLAHPHFLDTFALV